MHFHLKYSIRLFSLTVLVLRKTGQLHLINGNGKSAQHFMQLWSLNKLFSSWIKENTFHRSQNACISWGHMHLLQHIAYIFLFTERAFVDKNAFCEPQKSFHIIQILSISWTKMYFFFFLHKMKWKGKLNGRKWCQFCHFCLYSNNSLSWNTGFLCHLPPLILWTLTKAIAYVSLLQKHQLVCLHVSMKFLRLLSVLFVMLHALLAASLHHLAKPSDKHGLTLNNCPHIWEIISPKCLLQGLRLSFRT